MFSDIKRGCEINASGYNGQTTTICPSGGSQIGCQGWTVSVAYPLEYQFGDRNSANLWSGNASPSPPCGNNNTQTTYDPTWLKMSIVGGTVPNQQPSYSFPNTGISAWLCQTTAQGVQWNNSGAQGELYWLNFTSSSQVAALSVYGVTTCQTSPEDVEGGTINYNGQNMSGLEAIKQDMAPPTENNPPTSCHYFGTQRPQS